MERAKKTKEETDVTKAEIVGTIFVLVGSGVFLFASCKAILGFKEYFDERNDR